MADWGPCSQCGGNGYERIWNGEKYVRVVCTLCRGTGRKK